MVGMVGTAMMLKVTSWSPGVLLVVVPSEGQRVRHWTDRGLSAFGRASGFCVVVEGMAAALLDGSLVFLLLRILDAHAGAKTGS
jgi:hypothetical protein